MNIKKLPRDIQQKIKKHEDKISTLNSAELLSYSKSLRALKDVLEVNVCNYLFEVINERTKLINSGLDRKVKEDLQEAVNSFKKKVA